MTATGFVLMLLSYIAYACACAREDPTWHGARIVYEWFGTVGTLLVLAGVTTWLWRYLP